VRRVEGAQVGAGVVGGVVLDQDEVSADLTEGPLQERLVRLGVERAVEAPGGEGAAEAIEEAEGAMGLAAAAGGDGRLDPLEGSGVAPAPLLGEARLVAEEDDGALLPCHPQDLGPGLLEPEQGRLVVEVGGGELLLLIREA
jgi:hypothetical protein